MELSSIAEPSGARPFRYLTLGLNVQLVQELHSWAILQYFGDLYPSGNQLEYVSVVLERSALVFGGMPHLERVL